MSAPLEERRRRRVPGRVRDTLDTLGGERLCQGFDLYILFEKVLKVINFLSLSIFISGLDYLPLSRTMVMTMNNLRSVMRDRVCVGFLVTCGPKGVRAFDEGGRPIGSFESEELAARAVYQHADDARPIRSAKLARHRSPRCAARGGDCCCHRQRPALYF